MPFLFFGVAFCDEWVRRALLVTVAGINFGRGLALGSTHGIESHREL